MEGASWCHGGANGGRSQVVVLIILFDGALGPIARGGAGRGRDFRESHRDNSPG